MVVCIIFFVFVTAYGATYDATGMWNYSQSNLHNNCDEGNVPESGVAILVQNGNSAILIDEGRTLSGSVNVSTYTFNDYFYEEEGYTNLTINFTLASDSSGSGNFSWTWSDGLESCGGGGQLSVNKQSQASAIHDASGTWNYSTSVHYNNCDQPNESDEEGTITFTQTGNRVTAIDNHSDNFTGWVNSSTYMLINSYPDDGGTTSDVYTVTLSSQTSGSGAAEWFWNDVNDQCSGGFNVSISKQQDPVESKLSPAVPFLLLGNE